MYKNIKYYTGLFILFSSLLNAKEFKEVTLQPSWFEQFQFAGYYMAKEKGFYNEVGLSLKINPFTLSNQGKTSELVSNGTIDFATDKETLILERARNNKIVVLYALFQASPLVLLSTKESNISKIDDFFGKNIMASIGDTKQISLKAMLNSHGITLDDLNFLPHSHNINDLINNKVDIISAYVSKAPYDLEKQGIEYNIFSPHEHGFDLYSDFLYTSEEFIANNGEVTNAFRAASLRGWQYAFDNISETVDVIFEKYNQQNLTKEALLFEAVALKKLVYLNTEEIGVIDQSKVKKSVDLYRVLGVEKSDIDLTDFIYDAKNPHVFLTQEEKKHLIQKETITICIDPNWLPYEGLDSEGNHIGLNTEFFDIFRNQLPVPIETLVTSSWTQSVDYAKQRKCDLLSLAGETEERKEYLNFTSPYLVFPRVLVTKSNRPFVNNFSLLANKKIGMPRAYAQQEYIKSTFPEIAIVEVDTIQEGLERVARGELYGFIGGLDAVGYFLQEQFLGVLKVSGQFDNKRELGIGVRNDDPLLLNVFEKLINNLSQEEIDRILVKSTTIKYIEKFNYNILWWLLLLVVVIISAFLYRQSILNKLNKKLNDTVYQKTKALQELNESLERKIKERTQDIEYSKELLQNVAYKDSLTGIFNRHYLFEKSTSLFQLADQLDQPLSMLLIDIDHFKQVNDIYGHIVGDNLLKYTVENIKKSLRADDLFARYGGEEFIILLPKVNIDESLLVAEKLRRFIEKTPYQLVTEKKSIPITISIGVSYYQSGDSLEKLIDRADSALYSAKENGRNQVQAVKNN